MYDVYIYRYMEKEAEREREREQVLMIFLPSVPSSQCYFRPPHLTYELLQLTVGASMILDTLLFDAFHHHPWLLFCTPFEVLPLRPIELNPHPYFGCIY